MTLANPTWNWDLIIFVYSVLMFSGGYFVAASISKSIHERALVREYEKSEELREVINGLLNEITYGIDEIVSDIADITKSA
jgi:hypothetical protein